MRQLVYADPVVISKEIWEVLEFPQIDDLGCIPQLVDGTTVQPGRRSRRRKDKCKNEKLVVEMNKK